MQTQVEVHCEHDLVVPVGLRDDVLGRVAQLDDKCGNSVIRCRVNVGPRTKLANEPASGYVVRVVADVKGGEYSAHKADVGLATALSATFRALSRQLIAHRQRQKRDVKTHVQLPTGTVRRMVDDHGFLAAGDGHEVYFHRHSVVDGSFDRLAAGSSVSFVEQPGDRGARASTVRAHHGPNIPEMTRVPAT